MDTLKLLEKQSKVQVILFLKAFPMSKEVFLLLICLEVCGWAEEQAALLKQQTYITSSKENL